MNVELDLQRLETQVFDSPDVSHMLVGDLLELLYFVEEHVHVLDTIVKHDLLVVHYSD